MTPTADYQMGPFTFPRGWFAVETSEGVTRRPKAVRYFGRDFVVYRTEDGRPVMLDAYCPHMGSHLASGGMSVAFAKSPQVVGDRITCPLHGWRFGADGKCKEIPYSSIPIPAGARVTSHAVRDHAGFVLAWHDEEGGEPDFEPAPLAEWDDPQWLRGPIVSLDVIPTHQAEIIDHHVDKVHIVTVHGIDEVGGWVTRFDGARFSQRDEHHGVGLDGQPMQWTNMSDYRGPGMMIMRQFGPYPMVVFSASTPVDDGTTQFWHAFAIKRDGEASGQGDRARFDAIGAAMHQAFVEDMDILARKRPSINPMQIPGDGPFRKVRTWYSQFYNPRAMAAQIQARVNGDHATDGEVPAPWRATAA